MPQNFKKVGQNLFCSDYAMEQAVLNTHQFLFHLDRQVSFEELWQEKLLETYKGDAYLGQPPYAPAMILKMLFLSFLFKISEREVERLANDSISFKHFLGLGLIDKAPNHSTLTKFKNRVLRYQERTGRDLFKEIFDEVILHAQSKGIQFGTIQAIDGTHTIADVNNRKEDERTKEMKDGGQGKPPRDPDAKWGVKRTINVKTANGEKIRMNKSYYGYNNHLSVNTETNMVTSFRVTPFNAYEGHSFKPLMDDDVKKGVARKNITTYTADKAYDDGEIHIWLNQKRLKDAIALKRVTEKDKTETGKPKARWDMFTSQEEYEEGLKNRYAVERVNACLKKHHGLEKARYLGQDKMNIQTALTCLAHNLKTLVKLITGTGLRTKIHPASPVLAHAS